MVRFFPAFRKHNRRVRSTVAWKSRAVKEVGEEEGVEKGRDHQGEMWRLLREHNGKEIVNLG